MLTYGNEVRVFRADPQFQCDFVRRRPPARSQKPPDPPGGKVKVADPGASRFLGVLGGLGVSFFRQQAGRPHKVNAYGADPCYAGMPVVLMLSSKSRSRAQ